MHEALELLKYFNFNDEAFGATLAIVARCQGSSVSSIVANLEDSAARGSTQARDVLSFYSRADSALKSMAGGARHKAKPGSG